MKLPRTVLWFSALAILFAVTAYVRLPLLVWIASVPHGESQSERLEAYDSAELQPIGFHQFPAAPNQRVKLTLKFCPRTIRGAPNLAQTADGDRGVRLELKQDVLAVVYPGKHGVTGKVLCDDVQIGRWYDVDLEFQSGASLRASCSGGKPIYDTRIAATATDGVVVGRGYDMKRRFDGQIKGFSIESTPSVGMPKAEFAYLGFKVALIALAAGAVWRMTRYDQRSAGSLVDRIEPPPAGPLDPLLTLRAFAVVQVLMGHLFMCVFVSYRLPGRLEEEPWLCVLTPCPWAGVWVFFTLSGYLMGKGFYSGRYSCDPQRVYRYLSNRFLRIVPVYVSAVLLVSLVVCPRIFSAEHLSVLGSILTFDYNALERVNPIGALWSVTTEVQFYALVPVLFWGLSFLVGQRHERVLKVSAAVLLGGLVARLLLKEVVRREAVSPFIFRPLLGNLDLFLLGMLVNPLIAALRSNPWVARHATVRSAVLLIGGGYLLSSFVGAKVVTGDVDLIRLMIYGPTATAAMTMLIIGCCELGSASQSQTGLLRRVLLLGNGIGVLAYPIYVWHEPILLELRKLAPTPLTMGDAIKFSVPAVVLTWIVARLVYRYIELPTERLKTKPHASIPSLLESSDPAPATLRFPIPSEGRAKSKAA